MAKIVAKSTKGHISHHKSKTIRFSDYGVIGLFKENKGLLPIAEKIRSAFIKRFPTEKDAHFFRHTYHYRVSELIKYLEKYKELYEYLDLSPAKLSDLTYHLFQISNPDLNRKLDDFNSNFERLKGDLVRTDVEITSQLKRILKKECYRLFEAMKCLDNSCNYAAVVMSVSAVENRLHKLLRKANKKLYVSGFEKAALGGIIELFRRDTRYRDPKFDKFKAILPDKHKPLMEMLNIYRIFSAHPMEERISNQTAKAIVAFSFLLLIDESLAVSE